MPANPPNDIAALEPVRQARADGRAVLVLDGTLDRAIWANDGGARLLGGPDGGGERSVPRTVGRRRIAAVARSLAVGGAGQAVARLGADIGSPLETFAIHKAALSDGTVIVLVANAASANEAIDRAAAGPGASAEVGAAARDAEHEPRGAGSGSHGAAQTAPMPDEPAIIPPPDLASDRTSFSDGPERAVADDPVETPTPRFTWRSDENGRFTDVSRDLLDALEIGADEIVGCDATALTMLCHADRDRLGNVLADDASFTHHTVAWSVPRIGVRVPVAFSGTPQFDGSRFLGHRGHGKVRLADAVLDEDDGSVPPDEPERAPPHGRAAAASQAFQRTPRGGGALSASEREAFVEIGAALAAPTRDVAQFDPGENGADDATGTAEPAAAFEPAADLEPAADQAPDRARQAEASVEAASLAPRPRSDAPNSTGARGDPVANASVNGGTDASANTAPAASDATSGHADRTDTGSAARAPSASTANGVGEPSGTRGIATVLNPRRAPQSATSRSGPSERAITTARATSKVSFGGRRGADEPEAIGVREAAGREEPVTAPEPPAPEPATPKPATPSSDPAAAASAAAASSRFGRRLAKVADRSGEPGKVVAPNRTGPVAATGTSRAAIVRRDALKANDAPATSDRSAATPGRARLKAPKPKIRTFGAAATATPSPAGGRTRSFEDDLAGLAALSRVDQPLPADDEPLPGSGSPDGDRAGSMLPPERGGRGSRGKGSRGSAIAITNMDGLDDTTPEEALHEDRAATGDVPVPEPDAGAPSGVADEGPVPADDPIAGTVEDAPAARAEPRAVDTTLLQQLPIPVLVQDRSALRYLNPAFAELTGYETLDALREAGGMNALFGPQTALATPDGNAAPAGTLALRTRGGALRPVSVQMQSVPWSSDGAETEAFLVTLRTVSERGTLLGGENDGEAEESGPIALPFTDRRPIESRLASLNQVLDEATDGVVFLDGERRIRALSRSASVLLGYRDREIAGRAFAVLFAPESQAGATDLVERLGGDGPHRGKGVELVAQTSANDEVPLFVTVGAMRDAGGFCAVLRDMSEWRRTEEQLREAREEAEAASRQKTRFLTRVSHEIRTPLNAIIGFAEVMSEERFGPIGNERYREYLSDIHASGRHVLDLVNDLLDIAKIEAGRDDLSFEAVDLNEELTGAVALLEPQAAEGRVIVRTALGPLPPVVADRRSIKQIALNILSNAVRYTDPGGQVIVSTKAVAGGVTLRVRDTGVGMSQDDIDRALEPFTQVPSRSESMARRAQKGTGLGLPLTKAMAEANRAKFSISSVRGRGTLVELHFPPERVLR